MKKLTIFERLLNQVGTWTLNGMKFLTNRRVWGRYSEKAILALATVYRGVLKAEDRIWKWKTTD